MSIEKNNTIILYSKSIAVAVCVIFILSTYFSNGVFHADEYFQIQEFAAYKVGLTKPEMLAWEFRSELRPTLQPWIAVGVYQVFDFLGITLPLYKVVFLRLLAASAALFALYLFWKEFKSSFSENKQWIFLALLLSVFYMPVLSVRFSSESLSGSIFLIGLTLIASKDLNSKKALWAGLALGLAFEFRFQSAIATAGLGLWFLIFRFHDWKKIIPIAIGFIIVLLLGTLADWSFYEKICFTPWNYFKVNLLEGKAATFGVSPWWYYLEQSVFVLPIRFIGPIMLALCLIFCALNYKSILTWSFVFFFVIHSMIGHKEVRFIYPILPMVPFMMLWVLDVMDKKIKTDFAFGRKWMVGILLLAYFVINIPALVLASLLPLTPQEDICHFILKNKKSDQAYLVYDVDALPDFNYRLPHIETNFVHQGKIIPVPVTASILNSSIDSLKRQENEIYFMSNKANASLDKSLVIENKFQWLPDFIFEGFWAKIYPYKWPNSYLYLVKKQ